MKTDFVSKSFYLTHLLLICTWFLKNQFGKSKFEELDFYSILNWIFILFRIGFLFYFELDFYCLCSLQNSISKLIFAGLKSSSSNLIFQKKTITDEQGVCLLVPFRDFFLLKIPKLCLLQWCTKVLASCGPHEAAGLYHQSSYFLLQLALMGHLLIFPWSTVVCTSGLPCVGTVYTVCGPLQLPVWTSVSALLWVCWDY